MFRRITSLLRSAPSGASCDTADAQRKRLGRIGEDAAVKRLLRDGYRIIDRNFLCRAGEIDIIAEHRGRIVFVEVKTRSPRAWNTPESAVTPEKQARVMKAANYYLAGFRNASPARYDIVTVLTDENEAVTQIEVKVEAFGVE